MSEQIENLKKLGWTVLADGAMGSGSQCVHATARELLSVDELQSMSVESDGRTWVLIRKREGHADHADN